MYRMTVAVAASLVMAFGTARAQVVEKQRSNSTSNEKSAAQAQQQSKASSRNKVQTYTLGHLFFQQLAASEIEGARLLKLAGGDREKVDPAVPGAWLKSFPCTVFSDHTRFVYAQNQGATFDVGTGNGAAKMDEGTTAPGTSMRVFRNRAGLNLYGEPLFANDYVQCVWLYAALIDKAIKNMAKEGKRLDDTIYVEDLQRSAKRSLDAAIQEYQFTPATVLYMLNVFGLPLAQETRCVFPTPNGIASGMSTFACGSWRVSQVPLEAEEGGRVVLSQDTVQGVKYSFADASELAAVESTTRTNTKTSSVKRSEDQKAKVQK